MSTPETNTDAPYHHLGLLAFFLIGLCVGSLLTLVGLTLGHQLDWQNASAMAPADEKTPTKESTL